MASESKLLKILSERLSYVTGVADWSDVQLKKLQKDLLELLKDYTANFDRVDGIITMNARNMALVNRMDTVFNEFAKDYADSYLKGLGNKMLDMQAFSGKYYTAMGFGIDTKSIRNRLGWMSERIGIKDGKIISGSFLDTLANDPKVRTEIKSFMMGQVGNPNSTAKGLREGLTKLVTGTTEVGGTIERSVRSYVHDTVFQVDAAIDEAYAEDLGLKYFIYQGSLIDDSRQFCIDRVNKVFSKEDTKTWYDDPNLPKAKGETKEAYNPTVDRGRWNCRHIIRWITEELAKELGYEPVKV